MKLRVIEIDADAGSRQPEVAVASRGSVQRDDDHRDGAVASAGSDLLPGEEELEKEK